MNKWYLRFAYITGCVATTYGTVVVLVLLGMKKPIVIYPIGFFLAYLLVHNLSEWFKGKEEENKGIILMLSIIFLVIGLLFAIGPALIITIGQ